MPFFLIDCPYAISCGQSTDVSLQALRQAWDDTHPQPDGDADICEDGICAVPTVDNHRATEEVSR